MPWRVKVRANQVGHLPISAVLPCSLTASGRKVLRVRFLLCLSASSDHFCDGYLGLFSLFHEESIGYTTPEASWALCCNFLSDLSSYFHLKFAFVGPLEHGRPIALSHIGAYWEGLTRNRQHDDEFCDLQSRLQLSSCWYVCSGLYCQCDEGPTMGRHVQGLPYIHDGPLLQKL